MFDMITYDYTKWEILIFSDYFFNLKYDQYTAYIYRF